MRSLLAPIAMRILKVATRSYVTGPRILDAMGIANSAAQGGLASTICYWNDGTEDPETVLGHYLASLAAIDEAQIDADLAVKIPALWDRRDLVERIVGRAREVGRRVVFDSHAPAQSDLAFELLARLGHTGLGCAIPGRWRRSLRDAERAIELGVRVRVVKGQWPDPQQPDIDLRDGFLAVIDALAGRAASVGIATHDLPLAREAMKRLASARGACRRRRRATLYSVRRGMAPLLRLARIPQSTCARLVAARSSARSRIQTACERLMLAMAEPAAAARAINQMVRAFHVSRRRMPVISRARARLG
jgi:proline dehydrogenase